MNVTYHKLRNLLAMFILAGIIMQCQTSRIVLPAGFAGYESRRPIFKAVTADAVRLIVRSEPNQPRATLAVLAGTTELHFNLIGYKILEQKSILTTAGLQGRMYITAVQTLHGEYRYLTAIFVDGAEIRIVEAAGQKDAFEKHRAALVQKLITLETSYF